MRLVQLVCTLLGCLFFLDPPVAPTFIIDPPNATALLNDSTWFGKARALHHNFKYDRPCTDKHFSLGIMTDIPHSKEHYNRAAPVTGCMGQCLASQVFSISGVPLKVGKYDLSRLQRCHGASLPAIYILLVGGDVSVGDFYGQQGWIEVTKYEPGSKQVEGKFEATLKSSQGAIVCFTKGRFKSELLIEP